MLKRQTQTAGYNRQSRVPLYFSLALIIAGVVSYFVFPDVRNFFSTSWEVLTSANEELIRKWVDQFGFWGPIIIVLAMILQMFLLVLPTPLLMVVSVLAYGPVWGSLIILVAVCCASTVGYWIGYYLGAPLVMKVLGSKSEKAVEGFIEDYGFWAVTVTRLTPFLSNDAISFVAGILTMNYWQFMAATLIGITPLTILIAYLGENHERLKDGLVWGSLVCLILFVIYVWWDKRRDKR